MAGPYICLYFSYLFLFRKVKIKRVVAQLNSKFVENTNWDKKLKLSLSVEDGGAKRLIIVENDKWIGDINLTNIAPISVE